MILMEMMLKVIMWVVDIEVDKPNNLVAKFPTNTSGATWWSNLEKNTSGATLWPNLVSKYIFVRMCEENIGTN